MEGPFVTFFTVFKMSCHHVNAVKLCSAVFHSFGSFVDTDANNCKYIPGEPEKRSHI